MHMTSIARNVRWLAAAGVLALGLGACNSITDKLLDAPDPDVIEPGSLNSPEGAEAMRVAALGRLRNITAGGESAWMLGGLLVDEWKSGDTFFQRNETDQRRVQDNNANIQTAYRELHRARNTSREAFLKLEEWKPEPAYGLGQTYLVMGIAELLLGESFCSGVPFSTSESGVPEYGPPKTTQEIFLMALAHFDTGLTYVNATDETTKQVQFAMNVARARALLNLGRYADAATTVATVPDSFRLSATFALATGDNQIWALNNSAKRWVVGDSFDVGGRILNAVPFASAGDSRVPVAGTSGGASPIGKSFDGATNFVRQTLWAARTNTTPILSGVDARLVRAEARLAVDDYAGMMTILNALRAAPQNLGTINSAVMPALPVPTTRDDAINVFFRERAFWTFGRGQRLGDLRRLVRVYGRTPESTFPTGQFFKGGTYGNDMNFPVTVDEQNNPNFQACIDRNA